MEDPLPNPNARRALLAGLTLLLALGMGSVAYALKEAGEKQEAHRARWQCEFAAASLGEAGIGAAIFDLQVGGSGNLGSPERPIRLGDGVYWVRTEHLENGSCAMTSTGRAGVFESVTELLARPRRGGVNLTFETISLQTTPMVVEGR